MTRGGLFQALGWAVSLGMLSMPACGSDSDSGPACEDKACGGDIEGSWEVTEACYKVLKQPELECKEARADMQVDDASGAIVFDTDTFSIDAALNLRLVLNYPASCKAEASDSCAGFEGVVLGSPVDCVAAADGCVCEAEFVAQVTDNGIYDISGNQVELPGGDSDYCVQGDTLTIRPTLSMAVDGMGEMNLQLQTKARRR
ncbi:MAG: hypothetical protein ABW321_00465 [Polyangiales bacterium]